MRRLELVVAAQALALLAVFALFTWTFYARDVALPERIQHVSNAAHLFGGSAKTPQEESIEETPQRPDSVTRPSVAKTLVELPLPTPSFDFKEPDPIFLENSTLYVDAIMNASDTTFDRLECLEYDTSRYDYLKSSGLRRKYFFALDLFQCAPLLPRLLGSIVEAMKVLGPENCALSIVEGRSQDGTFEILHSLRDEVESIGAMYTLTTNAVAPKSGDVDRIAALAGLRNQALLPLLEHPEIFDTDATTVVFINDIALCANDILELVHQRQYQGADMTCAMDWRERGEAFYDVWISRTMHGELFFEIPQSSSWKFAHNLFWDDPELKAKQETGTPFQVYSCWNGIVAFTAKPLLERHILFRNHHADECQLGEPVHFCKDLWAMGHGKIAVIPSVNVGYNDKVTTMIKDLRGRVEDWTMKEENGTAIIEWVLDPPEYIKCYERWNESRWVSWDQGLER